MFSDIYRERRVFLTGHTGFKGSWLALWLQKLGATVHGYALPPEDPSLAHWLQLQLPMASTLADIRDAERLGSCLAEFAPEIVFHLAAQPLVLASYRDPLTTWQTNVMGTANLLEACRAAPSVKAVVVITTDKCYETTSGTGAIVKPTHWVDTTHTARPRRRLNCSQIHTGKVFRIARR